MIREKSEMQKKSGEINFKTMRATQARIVSGFQGMFDRCIYLIILAKSTGSPIIKY